jgi:hypothetical protein
LAQVVRLAPAITQLLEAEIDTVNTEVDNIGLARIINVG